MGKLCWWCAKTFSGFTEMKKALLLVLFFSGYFLPCFSANVHGNITDEKNQPLPFVNVFIQGTSTGTTANVDGNYSIDLEPGEYNLVFRMIGYRQRTERIILPGTSLGMNVQLFPESYLLKEVKVSASSEDPAYDIIRKAQKKRKYYLEQVKSYSCDAYVKSTQRITSYPKKILGQDVDLSEILDSSTGIVYLSESVSKLYFKQPDQYKEVMVSSKVSGNNRAFSFNQATDVLFNFYENLVDINGVSKRGFISPLAPSAFFYYRFTLEGTFMENGETVNKIHVVPRRMNDPVFQGDIYILDDSWRIHSTDLFVTKKQQVEFLDTLRIHQSFVPVEKNIWMNFSNQLSFVFSFFGFHGRGVVLGINNHYNIHPDFIPHFFNGEVMKIEKEANKKDSAYWEKMRPVPLISEETRDYSKRDSTVKIHESRSYRDSVDRKSNKFSLSDLLIGGYTYNKSYSHESFSFSPLTRHLQFNTVEGLTAGMDVSHSKRFKDDPWRGITFGTLLRYGFSNSHFNAYFYYHKRYDPSRLASYTVSAGTEVIQFNNQKPISELINTVYSLVSEENFMKIYEKRFASFQRQSELFNGFSLELYAEYADRLPLVNTSGYSIFHVPGHEYTSNDPLNPATDNFHFKRNQSLSLDVNARIRIKQQFMTRPEGKFISGSKYPTLGIQYRKGMKDIAGSDVDYDLISASVADRIKLGLIGTFHFHIAAGKFLNEKSFYFMDMHHFNGNQTILSAFRLNGFKLLNYYQYSTTNFYTEAHGEQELGGLILNKIPVIRKLKLNEVAGIHYLHTGQLKNYVELAIGIEKLNFFRIDFVTSFTNGRHAATGFVLGMKGIF
ncbi:MAG: DUF5686 and carboxypeptidase regulatory-like domain-containing protein [Bacteroidetes bacterium]|nr:DUF5686 and carboxypeptidase regulatory-like domain-containing protein [Bacteroidota bacterium]